MEPVVVDYLFDLPAGAELTFEAKEFLLPLAGAADGSFILTPFKVLALNVDFDFKMDLIVFGPETGSTPSNFFSGGREVVAAAKLPILNPNEFDLWKMRIEQYFLMTVYSLWEVILNGDSPIPTRVVDDAKSLMEAIEERFGRNKETKKNFAKWSSGKAISKVVLAFLSLSLATTSSAVLRGTGGEVLEVSGWSPSLLSSIAIEKVYCKSVLVLLIQSSLEALIPLEVILNGDSPIPTRVIDGVVQHVDPTTTKQRFGGNKETKKVQKPLLNQRTNKSVSAVASIYVASTKVLVSALPNVYTLSDTVIYSFFAIQSNRQEGIYEPMEPLLLGLICQWWNATTSTGEGILKESVGHSRTQGIRRFKRGMFHWRLLLLMHWFHSVMVLEAMTGAFRQKKNQPTMPSWHSRRRA
nr:ribonuclease H-like domain-containing protein [Tanacetum cinerariifolium]